LRSVTVLALRRRRRRRRRRRIEASGDLRIP